MTFEIAPELAAVVRPGVLWLDEAVVHLPVISERLIRSKLAHFTRLRTGWKGSKVATFAAGHKAAPVQVRMARQKETLRKPPVVKPTITKTPGWKPKPTKGKK